MQARAERLDPETLTRIVERFAGGTFEELFDVEWRSLDDFARAAREFVPSGDYPDFLDRLTDPSVWRSR